MGKESLLLQPLKVGNLTLKNRIMFPPLTTGYEERDGSIGERSLGFYERLAKGGASYVVIGDVAPVNTISPVPKLYDESHVPMMRKLADTLHRYDCKLALQIFHPEYDVASIVKLMADANMAMRTAEEAKASDNMELALRKTEESSSLRNEAFGKLRHGMTHFVSEVTIEQLEEIKSAFANCARLCVAAGVDAIEIHGDRLLGSLCSSLLNNRTDSYGGSFENRIKYALEVVSTIKKVAPSLMVEYKLPIITKNGDGTLRGKGGLIEEEACEFAKRLENAGVDMIQAAQANHTGNMGDTIPPMGTVPYNWTLPIAEKMKHLVNIPIATVGRVVTVEAGESILKNGQADVIAYGRSLLCDPDIANKVAADEPIRECLNCNKGCVDALQNHRYLSCVLNAENGDETTVFIKPGSGAKHIVVVGAGIAGLEAARVSAKRGYRVDIYDTSDKIGGQINLAAIPPRKSEILRSTEYYEKILPALGVTIHLGKSCTTDIMNQADAVIVAVGAHDVKLPIPGASHENVISSWDVLSGKAEVTGHCAVIGGGLVGTETAEYLLDHGCQVSIIEMTDKIANGESATILPTIMKHFNQCGVKQYENTKVMSIEDSGKTIKAWNTAENREVNIGCDYIVMAVGSQKNLFSVDGVTVPVYYVGDCAGEQTASIAETIRSAYKAANEI